MWSAILLLLSGLLLKYHRTIRGLGKTLIGSLVAWFGFILVPQMLNKLGIVPPELATTFLVTYVLSTIVTLCFLAYTQITLPSTLLMKLVLLMLGVNLLSLWISH